MNHIKILGIDLAKNSFQLHGVDNTNHTILKKKLSRAKLPQFVAQLPTCTIAMEACSGSNYWARHFQAMNHSVLLIAPQHVKPFVKYQKTDANDAAAIVEAATRPDIPHVQPKSIELQDIQSLFRLRQHHVQCRTALVNTIRGLLHEYGIVMARNLSSLRRALPCILEDANNECSSLMRTQLSIAWHELKHLDQSIASFDKEFKTLFQNSETAQNISRIPGVGPLSSILVIAAMGNPFHFKNSRHFAAWLGMVPRQHSTGGRTKLLGISKRGNTSVRTLLIHGARSALCLAKNQNHPNLIWAHRIQERRGFHKACVALASKNARIIWSMVAHGTLYKAA